MSIQDAIRLFERRSQRAGSVPGVAVTVATPGTSRGRSAARLAILLTAAVGMVVVAWSVDASAAWETRADFASGAVAARTLPQVGAPVATNAAFGAAVTLVWPSATYDAGAPVGAYVVRVSDATTGGSRAIGSGCAGRVSGVACVETTAPDGRWRYAVAAADGGEWLGVASPQSSTVTVDTTPPTDVVLAALPGSIRSGQVLTGAASDAVTGVVSMTYLACPGTTCTPATPVATSSAGPDFAAAWTAQPADGTYNVAARAVDGAGHATESTSRVVVIDNTAPAVAVAEPADGSTTNVRAVSFSGSAGAATGDAPAVTVRVYSGPDTGGAVVQTPIATRTGSSWSVTSTPLADGTYTVEATQTDAAGNTGTSATRTFTVDATAPAIVAITSGNGNGKVERNDTLRLTFGEPLDPATVPATTTLTVNNVNGAETIDVPGVTDGPVPTGSGGAATKNHSATWTASAALSVGNTVVTVTVTTNAAAWAGITAPPGTLRFVPARTLKDRAGNPAGGLTVVTLQLF